MFYILRTVLICSFFVSAELGFSSTETEVITSNGSVSEEELKLREKKANFYTLFILVLAPGGAGLLPFVIEGFENISERREQVQALEVTNFEKGVAQSHLRTDCHQTFQDNEDTIVVWK